jgi:hypothetical protein
MTAAFITSLDDSRKKLWVDVLGNGDLSLSLQKGDAMPSLSMRFFMSGAGTPAAMMPSPFYESMAHIVTSMCDNKDVLQSKIAPVAPVDLNEINIVRYNEPTAIGVMLPGKPDLRGQLFGNLYMLALTGQLDPFHSHEKPQKGLLHAFYH